MSADTTASPHLGARPARDLDDLHREVYAAAHVVADPWQADGDPAPGRVDWEATIAQRHHVWDQGIGVAEAMDTAQRGAGLAWPDVQELVVRSTAAARERGAAVAVGVGTDQLEPGAAVTLHQVVAAYQEQLASVTATGATPVLLCSRHLAHAAGGPADYRTVYDEVLSATSEPVMLHWLGEPFDAQLGSYWGSTDPTAAADTLLDVVTGHPHVSGLKMSLLDAGAEVRLRRRLPDHCAMFTGDDYHFADLMSTDDEGRHSQALLGAFAMMPGLVGDALRRLAEGDRAGFTARLREGEPLSRLVFEEPVHRFKVGVTWLAWLDGRQSHFRMLAGLESQRSVAHLRAVYAEAARIGLFADADAARARWHDYLALHGLGSG